MLRTTQTGILTRPSLSPPPDADPMKELSPEPRYRLKMLTGLRSTAWYILMAVEDDSGVILYIPSYVYKVSTAYQTTSLLFVVASVIFLMMESNELWSRENASFLKVGEYTCIAFFTLEFLMKWICIPGRKEALSFLTSSQRPQQSMPSTTCSCEQQYAFMVKTHSPPLTPCPDSYNL